MDDTVKIICLKVKGNVTASFSELAIKEALSPFMIVSFVEISSWQPSEGFDELV